ncbi:endopeptidase La [Candidatus Woesebacteria bacterium]|nr:endopeptidase La [Candidatus Woesebacteria bacterium]
MTDQKKETDQPKKDTAVSGTVISQTELTPATPEKVVHTKSRKKEKEESTDIYPIVPIREGVLFPSTESVLSFGRNISVAAIKESAKSHKVVVLLTQKSSEIEVPQPDDLYEIGTLAIVEKTLQMDQSVNALVRGIGRVKVLRFITTGTKLSAQVETLKDTDAKDEEMEALIKHVQKEFRKAVHLGKPVEFLNFMKLMGGVTNGELVDQIASTLSIKTLEKQELLEIVSVKQRIKRVIEHLAHELKVLEIEKDVVNKTQEKFDKHMRDSVLRERLSTIRKELGEADDEEEIIDEYFKKLKKIQFENAETQQKIEKEIKRLRTMSPNNPESGYVRTWLDTVFELPWDKRIQASVTLQKAAEVLSSNHYGLEEVKDRILEYIAVLLRKQQQLRSSKVSLPTILCFVGPPGVGKTSIGQSIAKSLGRKFVKVSLGGVHDEAEIRGHRRTYVGAMTGKIMSGIRQAKTLNPVFMLDEVDKIASDYRGDPSSALLEALDPEQNKGFVDHYLDMPFDLSEVIFITTANSLDTIPGPLRDRLEIITYSGYTQEEKFHIAKEHLLAKVLKANGMSSRSLEIPDELINTMIQRFTSEAGVRSLERTLSKVARKAARELLEHPKTKKVTMDTDKLREYLGAEPFDVTRTEAEDQVGLATGLAWTSVGGDVLFIEVALTPGKGHIQLTGKLGDVMKESAQAALTFVKANAKELKIDSTMLQKTDVHIHVPEGAVPKDGPSAGVTITTAIVSAFTKRPVKRTVAMTGEVTLRGRVLRIGGLKEKSIAALRAGSTTVLIPQDNERDLEKIPASVKEVITFIPVSDVREVLKHALVEK